MASKLPMDPKKVAAQTQVRATLRAIPREELATFALSVGAVSVLLDKDPKTLYAARLTRDEWLAEGKAIHPLSLESIPYAGTPNAATYMALDVIEYLNREALAPTLSIKQQSVASNYPSLNLPRAFLCFQRWLAHADATELWPFAIQADGRPMDFIAALLDDSIGDEIRWLTIRQFSDLVAHGASHAFSQAESEVILPREEARDDGQDENQLKRDRWSEPGGPI